VKNIASKPTITLSPFRGLVWRIIFADQKHRACEPVDSPVGRFHHSKQVALYTSCTEEGAAVAIKRYVSLGDPERIIVPLEVSMDCIYDIRHTGDSRNASVVWQDIFSRDGYSPTWEYSDVAREAGAQGMLYSSRSRPELSHFVLFDVSAGLVKQAGDCRIWRY